MITCAHPAINRYWDDGTLASKAKRRYYAVRKNSKPQMSHRNFVKFLTTLSPEQLNVASKIVRVTSELDLNDVDREFVEILRENNDLLLIPEDCNYKQIRESLIALHKFGILNLSLNPLEDTVATLKLKCQELQAKNRSVTAQLRESRKRYVNAVKRSRINHEDKCRAESERDEYKRLLTIANSHLTSFRATHPDWEPPKDISLAKDESLAKDAHIIFTEIESKTDRKELIDQQMRVDPSGVFHKPNYRPTLTFTHTIFRIPSNFLGRTASPFTSKQIFKVEP